MNYARISFDLHTHSNVSDGTETPVELVRAMHAAGIRGFALTDHDSTAGWTAAANAAADYGIEFIPGIELSTNTQNRSVHILGYFVDPDYPALLAELKSIREHRRARAQKIVERLADDYPLSWVEVLEHASERATIGRPHIADALISRGYAADRGEVFAGILHPRSGYLIQIGRAHV